MDGLPTCIWIEVGSKLVQTSGLGLAEGKGMDDLHACIWLKAGRGFAEGSWEGRRGRMCLAQG
eukprot:364496-Chlamydomonas_euryale.AAC.27